MIPKQVEKKAEAAPAPVIARRTVAELFPAVHRLPLSFVSTDGGEYGHGYECRNLLQDNGTAYSSVNHTNVNVLCRHTDDKRIVVSHVAPATIFYGRSARFPGFTAPWQSALVFVLDEASQVADTKEWDSCSRSKYLTWKSQNPAHVTSKHRHCDPVAYIHNKQDGSGNLRCQVQADYSRTGPLLLLKMLGPMEGTGPNIDAEYFGADALTEEEWSKGDEAMRATEEKEKSELRTKLGISDSSSVLDASAECKDKEKHHAPIEVQYKFVGFPNAGSISLPSDRQVLGKLSGHDLKLMIQSKVNGVQARFMKLVLAGHTIEDEMPLDGLKFDGKPVLMVVYKD